MALLVMPLEGLKKDISMLGVCPYVEVPVAFWLRTNRIRIMIAWGNPFFKPAATFFDESRTRIHLIIERRSLRIFH